MNSKIKYIISEKDIMPTLQDFEIFCNYISSNKIKLTRTRQELGKKNCFDINNLLSKSKDVDGPKYLQANYPTINLFYYMVLEIGLFKIDYSNISSQFLVTTNKFKKYNNLSNFNKYMLLLKTYCILLDFRSIYADSIHMLLGFQYIEMAFKELAKYRAGERIFANIEDFKNSYDYNNPIHRFFVSSGEIVHHLSIFGFWEYEEAKISDLYTAKRDICIKSLTINNLGLTMIDGYLKAPYNLYSIDLNDKSPKKFESDFEIYFPKGAIDVKAIDTVLWSKQDTEETSGNIYIFKVSLNKQTWRRIKIASSSTLENLHKVIQNAFDFDDDHLFAFFMDGKAWSHNAYWDERSNDEPSATKAVLSKLNLIKGKKFLYLFDFGDEWKFDVVLEDVIDMKNPPKSGKVIEEKGQSPKQYYDYDNFEYDNFESEKSVEEIMINALMGLKGQVEKNIVKRENELWRKIEPPFSFKKLLEGLTKSELTIIRNKLNLKGISSLKKDQLIDVLNTEIGNSIEKVISYFDDNQYKIIKKIVNNNGSAQMDLSISQIEFYRELGLVFSATVNNKRTLIIPSEFIQVLSDIDKDFELHKKIKRNTKWARITQGLIYYYGAVEINNLVDMIIKYTGDIDTKDYRNLLSVLDNTSKYYGKIRYSKVGYYDFRIFEPEKILKEQNKRYNLEHYPFTYNELNKAGEEEFVDKNIAFKNFTKFLMDNYTISLKEAEDIVEECVYLIKLSEPPQSIINLLQKDFEIGNLQLLQEFMHEITFLHNNTRQWEIKGYTPNELSKNEKNNLKPLPNISLSYDEKIIKIGRNDLCPCGSGKKYKKCCGK